MGIWRLFRGRKNCTIAKEKRTFLLIALLAAFFLILLLRASTKQIRERKRFISKDDRTPCIVLLWNNFNSENDHLIKFYCNYQKCLLTGDRKLLSKATVILFYGSNMVWYDFPLPRKQNQIWALLHEESPRNKPEFMYEELWKYFNYTSTFSRYSDFPLIANQLDNVSLIIDVRFMTSVGHKNSLRTSLAPVLFIQSDCSTMTARTNYIEELMKYIPIDSYGGCLNNRKLPESLQKDYLNELYTDEILRFIGQYKFMISIENGVCNDYITEKYWRPLIAGVIPIYYGSPTIRDWEPHNHSAIYITDFKSPKELANFVLELDRNDTEYIKYLHHKFNQIEPITNMRLIDEMYIHDEIGDIFINFSCQVLKAMWLNNKQNPKMANRMHYSCPQPIPYPTMQSAAIPSEVRLWNEIITRSGCMAKAVDELLQKNQAYTEKELNNSVKYKIQNELC